MSGPLASWWGTHSPKFGPVEKAVGNQYALAASPDGMPLRLLTPAMLVERTGYGDRRVREARSKLEESGALKRLRDGGGRREGGAGIPAEFQLVVETCSPESDCRDCAVLGRARRAYRQSQDAQADHPESTGQEVPGNSTEKGARPAGYQAEKEARPAGYPPRRGADVPKKEGRRAYKTDIDVATAPLGGAVAVGGSGDREPPAPSQAPAARSDLDEPSTLAAAIDETVPAVPVGALPPPAVRELREQIEAAGRAAKVETALGRPLSPRAQPTEPPPDDGDGSTQDVAAGSPPVSGTVLAGIRWRDSGGLLRRPARRGGAADADALLPILAVYVTAGEGDRGNEAVRERVEPDRNNKPATIGTVDRWVGWARELDADGWPGLTRELVQVVSA